MEPRPIELPQADRAVEVDVSVVVPAFRPAAVFSDCLESLLSQSFEGTYEVIAAVSADSEEHLPVLEPHPQLRVLTFVPRLSAAAARNRAVEVANGRSIAFTDADVIVSPGWLNALVANSLGKLCVAGSVQNGTPRSSAGTAEYLVAFLDLHPARPPRTAWHGATCNLLVPRTVWNRYGPFPEDMGGGEDTLLTVAARADGLFVFAPDACVTHMNRTRIRSVLMHQFEAGRYAAILARRSAYKMRPLVRYTILAPVAAAGRAVSLYARVIYWDSSEVGRALRLAPLVITALLFWGAGLAFQGALLDVAALRSRSMVRVPDRREEIDNS